MLCTRFLQWTFCPIYTHATSLRLHPQAASESAVAPHNTTPREGQLGATGRQTDSRTPPAQQARTPSCGGHGVSHARLPGRPLGPRRDLLTAHLLRAFRADGRTRSNIIVPRGQASDLRVGGLHGGLPLAARDDDDEKEDDRHVTVTDKRRGPQPRRWQASWRRGEVCPSVRPAPSHPLRHCQCRS